MGYEIARGSENEHTSPRLVSRFAAHVTADDFPRLERDDEKQIAAEQKREKRKKKGGTNLGWFSHCK